jgi:signal transduction histidine kinase
MKNSFALRLTLRVAALVTLTILVVLALGGWLLKRQVVRSIEILQDIEGGELAGLLRTRPGPGAGPAEIKRILENEADGDIALYFVQVRDARDAVVYRSANLGAATIPAAPAGSSRWDAALPIVGEVRVTEFPAGPWRVQIGSALSPADNARGDYLAVSTALLAITALLSLLVGHAFSRMTLAPIRAIESTARRIRADNLSERIPVPPGRDELASLAALLNRTFDHLETAFAQVRRFTADASHELKTPLALVRLSAEKLRPRLAGDPEADALLADLLDETDRMHRIIESLLFIAKAEGGALVLERKPREMAAFIADFLEDARALAEDRGLRIRVGENTPGRVLVDPHSLRQLLLNLVGNAITASPPGGLITLDSGRTATGWRLAVTDEGPGLPPEMLGRIFERFMRCAPAAGNPGQGLGLAICRSIAELHGGKIRAENRPDRPGLRVVMEW